MIYYQPNLALKTPSVPKLLVGHLAHPDRRSRLRAAWALYYLNRENRQRQPGLNPTDFQQLRDIWLGLEKDAAASAIMPSFELSDTVAMSRGLAQCYKFIMEAWETSEFEEVSRALSLRRWCSIQRD